MAFQIVQVIYWLALSTWFGGVMFVTVAAQVILRALREANPILPDVLSVNLEGQHATLLGSRVVGNVIESLVRVELLCAGGTLLALIGQWVLIDVHNSSALVSAILRSVLFVAATMVVIYDWRVAWPRVLKFRQEFIDHADEPDRANAAMDQFNKYQRETFTLLMTRLALLLGIVLFSGGIVPAVTIFPATR